MTEEESKQLRQKLLLVNLSKVARQIDVPYYKLRDFKSGKVKALAQPIADKLNNALAN